MTAIATLTVNPAVDIHTSVDRMVPDEKLRAERVTREPGGGGINVARAVANLGGEATAIHTQGGSSGDALSQLLEGTIDARAVQIEDDTRENVSVTESTTDNQFRLVMPGPTVTSDEWEACLDAVDRLEPQPEWLVASGSLAAGLADDAYARLAERCRERGIPLILDTSGAPLREACEVGTFLIKPNLGELARLVDRELASDEQIAEAVEGLIDGGAAEVVVVSMGAGGAYVAGSDLEGHHVRAPTVPIKSKVGAGDSMVAGIVLALSRGEALLDAARFGVAAGAAAVMTEGSGLCRREDTERLYEQMRG
ncbi:MAG: 1-phosphofructokinase family hexose kinase [Nitriliruptorales bacterium]|nr:1-phosphofructokinase family hexose kinase [Nitriliruptorales bacterium]